MPRNLSSLVRILCVLALALWLGGLTFYAGVVVPIGTEWLGTLGQGAITQQVTDRLNQLGIVAILLAFAEAGIQRSKSQLLLCALLTACHMGLLGTHAVLSHMFDPVAEKVTDSEHFYTIHRVYLLITTAQWLAGTSLFVMLLSPPARTVAAPEPGDSQDVASSDPGGPPSLDDLDETAESEDSPEAEG